MADVIALHVVLDIDKLEDEDNEAYAARAAKYCYHALGLVRKLPNWSGGSTKSSGHFDVTFGYSETIVCMLGSMLATVVCVFLACLE